MRVPVDGPIGPRMAGNRRYTVVGQLGEGSTGLVHVARDTQLDRLVALKTLRAITPEELYRLKTEFRSLAQLSHPNLAQLYDLVVTDEQCFFTMELINGVEFIQYVRGSSETAETAGRQLSAASYDQLRDALRQLAAGLGALHAHGKLHRDVKPTNVLVEADGRVVLLDFGLVSNITTRAARDREEDALAGTLAYMAPEQLGGATLSAAADWYSVGVMLFEALTGRLPYRGMGLRSLAPRSAQPVQRPRALAPETPADLDELTVALLSPHPGERLSSLEALRTHLEAGPLQGEQGTRRRALTPPETPFVGRHSEMLALSEAFLESRQRALVTVTIEGISGIGKTALVDRFLSNVAGEDVLILRGRCHPQETVTFEAVDGLVDDLARFLLRQPPESVDAVLPMHTAALARLFPVLARVPAIAAARGAGISAVEPREIRQRAFVAFRELLQRLADRMAVVLWIDDAQWGDLDGAALLCELWHAADPPRALLLLSFRSEDGEAGPVLHALAGGSESGQTPLVRHLHLGPLPPPEVETLARAIVSESGLVRSEAVQAIVDECGGSPFFVCELARHFAIAPEEEYTVAAGVSRLAGLVAARIERLPRSARRLLEVVAVSGQPLDERIAYQIAKGSGDALHALSLLRNEYLVRSVPSVEWSAVASYHDRIRETVIALLPVESRRSLHYQLAEAYEALLDPDPRLLVEHYLQASEPQRAGRHAYAAAEKAAGALAFHRAASFYRQALELGASACPVWQLHAKLGEALINAGRGADGATSLLAAAAERYRDAPSDVDIVCLKRRAAEHYLRSGRHAEGLQVMREVLAAVGLPFAATLRRAVLSLVTNRLRLQVHRALRPHQSPVALAPLDRERLEVCWSAGLGLSYFDSLRAAEFQVRHALLAHQAGDTAHLARALATEAVILVWEGGARRHEKSRRLEAAGERLARATGDPNVLAHAQVMHAGKAYVQRRFRDAVAICEQGEAWCRERCVGAAWELANFQNLGGCSLAFLGDFTRLWEQLPQSLREATERGDEYALLSFRLGPTNLAWLAADQPDEARRQADVAAAQCDAGGFFGYQRAFAYGHIDLYAGECETAWERLVSAWPHLRRSQILRFQIARIDLLELHARCAMALAATTTGLPETRRSLLRVARKDVQRLAAEDVDWVVPLVDGVRASLAALAGERALAAQLLERSAGGFERLHMSTRAAAARYQLGALLEVDAAESRQGAEQTMRLHGVINPGRMARMFAPGFAT